ncbi:MAG: hypothetical protein EAX86_00475 [Candidatus Heimdallarchaeota archaeon]|nr:hypothetical protein [Candidatus Heimdallarchaeota archaeon]
MPYGEVTILSLANLTSGTKFQLYGKVKSVGSDSILVSDEFAEFKFTLTPDILIETFPEEMVLIFGYKVDSGVQIERILKTNIDWELYKKTRELESR